MNENIENLLREAMPVIPAPQSLGAENVVKALEGKKKNNLIVIRKYAGIAVAAAAALAIGAATVSRGNFSKSADMESYYVSNEYDYMEGNEVGAIYGVSPDSTMCEEQTDEICLSVGDDCYIGSLSDAVPDNDENRDTYIGETLEDIGENVFTLKDDSSMEFLCYICLDEKESSVIVFLHKEH